MIHSIMAREGAFGCVCHMGLGGYEIDEAEEEEDISCEPAGFG